MSSEIRLFVENCETCARHTSKQQPETLFLHPVPDRLWHNVGIEIFTIKSRNYLVRVDYLSNFYEVDFLPDTLASTCIRKIKYHFATHGIRDVVVSDNGSQFSCREFSAFAAKWEFSNERSSPGNSKSNGAAEAVVKDANKFMNKCNEEKSDPYLGLLNVRNTPAESLRISPVQRLFGRRTRTVLPTLNDRLKLAADTSADIQKKETRRQKAAENLHHRRKDLPSLISGAKVFIQPIDGKSRQWQPVVITDKTSSRSYEVSCNGRVLQRNRQFIRPAPTTAIEGPDQASSPSPSPKLPGPSTPVPKTTPSRSRCWCNAQHPRSPCWCNGRHSPNAPALTSRQRDLEEWSGSLSVSSWTPDCSVVDVYESFHYLCASCITYAQGSSYYVDLFHLTLVMRPYT